MYQSPDVIVCDCVLEGGFAMSVMSEQYDEGNGNLYDLMGNTEGYEGENNEGDFWNNGGFGDNSGI